MQETWSDNPYFPQMKRVAQITQAHCGPAVLQMLLSFWNREITQNQVTQAINMSAERIADYGMTVQELAAAAAVLAPDMLFWYKDLATTSEVYDLIHYHKIPVGVEWQGIFLEYSDDDDGHYSIITHLDLEKSDVFVADPFEVFAGKDRRFHVAHFSKRWWDVNEIIDPTTGHIVHKADDRMIFIVTHQNAHFPLDMGMKSNADKIDALKV